MDIEERIEMEKEASESAEHWELRRSFMRRWKDEIPFDGLVCLARVFCNIELLGCRYPAAVMARVARLSEEVAEEFRQRRKSRLRRTFVSASAAAEQRVKRAKLNENENNKVIKFVNTKPEISNKYGNLVLFDRQSTAVSKILDSCQTNKIKAEFKVQETSGAWSSTCYVNEIPVCSGTATAQKLARENAAEQAWKILQKDCYTVVTVQKHISQDNTVISADNMSSKKKEDEALEDNKVNSDKASRMMKMMGWKGGGLGAASDGRSEPIIPNSMRISRAGLGNNLSSDESVSKALLKTILDFKKSEAAHYDLIFSQDFTKEERTRLHALALKNGLKSKSHGKDDGRYLVISKFVAPQRLVSHLLESGGENEKYKLIAPTCNR